MGSLEICAVIVLFIAAMFFLWVGYLIAIDRRNRNPGRRVVVHDWRPLHEFAEEPGELRGRWNFFVRQCQDDGREKVIAWGRGENAAVAVLNGLLDLLLRISRRFASTGEA